MNEDTETMFTVTMSFKPNGWGETLTMRLLNPDGTVCVQEAWPCGPDGFTNGVEGEVARWVGEQAQEFMDIVFTSAQEQGAKP